MKKMIKQQKGFTLIELVVVIAVLGILAAFALPRFVNFTGEANTAARAGFVGALSSAVGIAKAKYVAQGSTGTVTLDGAASAITMNAQGWPDVGTTYATPASCTTLFNNLLQNPSGVTAGYTGGNCTLNKAGGNWGTGSDITLSSSGVVN